MTVSLIKDTSQPSRPCCAMNHTTSLAIYHVQQRLLEDGEMQVCKLYDVGVRGEIERAGDRKSTMRRT